MEWILLVTLLISLCLLSTAQNFQNAYFGSSDGPDGRQTGNIFTVGGDQSAGRNIPRQFSSNQGARNFGGFPASSPIIGGGADVNFGPRAPVTDERSNLKLGNSGNVIGVDRSRVVSPAPILGGPVDIFNRGFGALQGNIADAFSRVDSSGTAALLEALERFAPNIGGPAIPLGGDARIRGGIRASGGPVPSFGPAAALGGPAAVLGGPAAALGGPAAVLGGPAAVLGGPAAVLGGPAAALGGPAAALGGPAAVLGGPAAALGGPAAALGGPAAVLGGPAAALGGTFGTGPIGQVNRVFEAPVTPTVTQTITIDRFETLTDTAFHSVPVTLTDLFVRTVTATTRQVLQTPRNDFLSLETTVLVRPTSVTVTATDTEYRYVTETLVNHVTITHTDYRIKQATYTRTATQALTHTSTFVRTIVRTQRTTLTDYHTITDIAYAPKPYY